MRESQRVAESAREESQRLVAQISLMGDKILELRREKADVEKRVLDA